jgi:hypothetical protein
MPKRLPSPATKFLQSLADLPNSPGSGRGCFFADVKSSLEVSVGLMMHSYDASLYLCCGVFDSCNLVLGYCLEEVGKQNLRTRVVPDAAFLIRHGAYGLHGGVTDPPGSIWIMINRSAVLLWLVAVAAALLGKSRVRFAWNPRPHGTRLRSPLSLHPKSWTKS